jgi:hypothetical protein
MRRMRSKIRVRDDWDACMGLERMFDWHWNGNWDIELDSEWNHTDVL